MFSLKKYENKEFFDRVSNFLKFETESESVLTFTSSRANRFFQFSIGINDKSNHLF